MVEQSEEIKHFRPFVASYSKWLQTHSRSHKEYEDRKRYPWHVLGSVTLLPGDLPWEGKQVVSAHSTPLGTITVIAHEFRTARKRHQIDVRIDDRVNNLQANYRIVFAEDGTLVTIHVLGSDVLRSLGQRFIESGVDALGPTPPRKVLLAALRSCCSAALRSWRDQGYIGDASFEVPWTRCDTLRTKRLRVDLAKGRQHWLLIRLFEYEAHALARRCVNTADSLTVAYAVPNVWVPHPFAGDERVVQRIEEVAGPDADPQILARIAELRHLSAPLSKYGVREPTHDG